MNFCVTGPSHTTGDIKISFTGKHLVNLLFLDLLVVLQTNMLNSS